MAVICLNPAPVRQPSRLGYIPAWGRRRCRNARSVNGAGCCAGRVMPVARAEEAWSRHRQTATMPWQTTSSFNSRYPLRLKCQSQFLRTSKFKISRHSDSLHLFRVEAVQDLASHQWPLCGKSNAVGPGQVACLQGFFARRAAHASSQAVLHPVNPAGSGRGERLSDGTLLAGVSGNRRFRRSVRQRSERRRR